MIDLYSREHIGREADIWVRAVTVICAWSIPMCPCLASCLNDCVLPPRADALIHMCAAQSLGVLLFYMCFQALPFEGDCKLQVSPQLFIAVPTYVSVLLMC